jgi:hypothetical protein
MYDYALNFGSKTFKSLTRKNEDKTIKSNLDNIKNTINRLNDFIFEEERKIIPLSSRSLTNSNFWSNRNEPKLNRIETKKHETKTKMRKTFSNLSKTNEIQIILFPQKKDDEEIDSLVETIIAFTSARKNSEIDFNVSDFSFDTGHSDRINRTESRNESFYMSEQTNTSCHNNDTITSMERKRVRFSDENAIKYYTNKSKIIPYKIHKVKIKDKKVKSILKNSKNDSIDDEKVIGLHKLNLLIKECEVEERKEKAKNNIPKRKPLSEIQNTAKKSAKHKFLS